MKEKSLFDYLIEKKLLCVVTRMCVSVENDTGSTHTSRILFIPPGGPPSGPAPPPDIDDMKLLIL